MARQILIAILVLGLTAASSGFAAAEAQEVDPAFTKDVLRLMDMTGSLRLGEQLATIVAQQTFQNLRTVRPDIPPRALEIADEVVRSTFAKMFSAQGGLLERMIPLYARHFTHDDVRGLIAFYETPVGQKAIRVMPLLAQEGAQIGQEWAAGMGPQLEAEMRRRFEAEGLGR